MILLDLIACNFHLGNLLIFFMLMVLLNRYVLDGAIHGFQNRALPWIMGHYESLLRWALKGWSACWLAAGHIWFINFIVYHICWFY